MIHLIEISIPRSAAIAAATATEPLGLSDIRVCAKTWLAGQPNLACRPWLCVESTHGLRIVGWRNDKATCSLTDRSIYFATRAVCLNAGDKLQFAGEVVATRRNYHRAYDAATDRLDKKAAYKAWITERLVDLMPYADIEMVHVLAFRIEKGLRKLRKTDSTRSKILGLVKYPVVRAEIGITVREAPAVEAWLLTGLGPHKAFGFGCFIPTAGTECP